MKIKSKLQEQKNVFHSLGLVYKSMGAFLEPK
jgi:hypothetical protein